VRGRLVFEETTSIIRFFTTNLSTEIKVLVLKIKGKLKMVIVSKK
jgi:hypothetical protein